MRKKLALLLAVMLVISLFAGCGNKAAPAQTNAPTSAPASSAPASSAPASSAPASSAPASSDPAPVESEEPQPLFATDERGIATEPYNWPLPLTTSDDTISYWTTIWTPEYIKEDGGFGETALPVEAQRRTGVHVEYVTSPSNNRGEAFSVLLAADDLCDIMTNAISYYPGTPVEMVEEEYFVNIYDYRELMPNYLYHSTYAYPNDVDTHTSVFYYEDFIPVVYCMSIVSGEMIGGFCFRGDYLDKVGLKSEEIVTWDDLEDALTRLKVGIDTVEYPMWIAQTIEMQKYWQFVSLDSMTAISSSALPPMYVKDGEIKFGCTTPEDKVLMTKLSDWYSKGLINPDWAGYTIPADFSDHMNNSEIAYQYQGATTLRDAIVHNIDPNCTWVVAQKPLLEPNQKIHIGNSLGRTGTGNCSFATKNNNLELCMKWIDYRYSPEGYELYTYGPEGVVCYTDENGERHNTEFALNNPDGLALSWLVFIYSMDAFVDPALADTNTKLFNPDGDMARAAIAEWTEWLHEHYDAAWLYPKGARLTSEQSEELGEYRSNVVTYIAENFTSFMDGSKSLDEYDSYVESVYDIGLREIIEIYQTCYDDYMASL